MMFETILRYPDFASVENGEARREDPQSGSYSRGDVRARRRFGAGLRGAVLGDAWARG